MRGLREGDLAAHYNQTPPRNRRPNRNCDRTPAAFLLPQDDPPTQGSNSGPRLYPVKTRLRTAQCLFYFFAAVGTFPRCETNRRTASVGVPVRSRGTLEAIGHALLEVRQEGRGGGEAEAVWGRTRRRLKYNEAPAGGIPGRCFERFSLAVP